jgi:LEA14-like dessication related protein
MTKALPKILLAILLLSSASLGLIGCSRVVRAVSPRITAVDISLTEVTLVDFTMEVKVTIENTNPITAELKDVESEMLYRVGSDWGSLAKGSLASATVGPNDSQELTIPTTVKHRDAVGAMAQFLAQHASINLRLIGSADAKVGPASFTIPFEQNLTFSLGSGVG